MCTTKLGSCCARYVRVICIRFFFLPLDGVQLPTSFIAAIVARRRLSVLRVQNLSLASSPIWVPFVEILCNCELIFLSKHYYEMKTLTRDFKKVDYSYGRTLDDEQPSHRRTCLPAIQIGTP